MHYVWLLPIAGFAMAAASPYEADVEKWRQGYEEKLRAPDGWLSLAGLFWLHEGANSVGSDPRNDVVLPKSLPGHAGQLTLLRNTAVFRSDSGEHKLVAEKEAIKVGNVSLALIERDHRFAIRMRDPNVATRTQFSGSKWFPVYQKYNIEAKWVTYDPPHTIAIMTILGYTERQNIPGYAEFALDGHTYRLEPIVEEPGELFFIFKDQTAGRLTYGAGRFLKAKDAVNGKVLLDFNRAYNPPCAYTAFATCPLPPKQNVLAARIEAGELKYGGH